MDLITVFCPDHMYPNLSLNGCKFTGEELAFYIGGTKAGEEHLETASD